MEQFKDFGICFLLSLLGILVFVAVFLFYYYSKTRKINKISKIIFQNPIATQYYIDMLNVEMTAIFFSAPFDKETSDRLNRIGKLISLTKEIYQDCLLGQATAEKLNEFRKMNYKFTLLGSFKRLIDKISKSFLFAN